MPVAMIIEFEGVTEDQYNEVSRHLNIDHDSGKGDWPDGIHTHAAGFDESGRFYVIEVWETADHHGTFLGSRLGEALAKAGMTGPPAHVTTVDLLSHNLIKT